MKTHFVVIPFDESRPITIVNLPRNEDGSFHAHFFENIVGGETDVIYLGNEICGYVHKNLRNAPNFMKYENARATNFFASKNLILGNIILFELNDNGFEIPVRKEIIDDLRYKYMFQ